ncbi:uncharacterized protein LOC124697188 [Lolium rigidum]|uniref:uncharacterized protein LOC124697188 n=1 Tax=Lolium rigidum TaxID=89674 RepID=UPI001F5C392F|nr:uncharacterized protein LOC124697188 [Lolium rigidum]
MERGMGEGLKAMLAKPIKLADQVAKQAGSGQCFRPECKDLRARAEKLAEVLRQAARADLYERPAERIVNGTMQALAKAGAMAKRCFDSHSRLRRFLSFNPVSGFPRTLALLDTAVEDVAWLIRISSPRADAVDGDDDDLRGMPNIAQNDPILFLIWDHIARLHTGSLAVRADSASTLASLARDNPHFAKLIVEEDGVVPLVRLLKEGSDDGQEAAATALGLLGRDEASVDRLIHAGVCAVYAATLKEPPMRVQAAVAEAIASLASHSKICQDLFAQTNSVVRHLVSHLAAGTIQEHSRYSVAGSSSRSTATPPPEPMRSLHSVVLASTPSMLPGTSTYSANEPPEASNAAQQPARNNQMQSAAAGRTTTTNRVTAPPPTRPQLSSNGSSGRGSREAEDPATKARMKAMAAKALWKLAHGHPGVCKNITESRALLCFARLLEKGDGGAGTHLQFYSAMAIMEITRVAEHNLALRQSAFKPSSPPAKAVAEQLLCIVRNGEHDDDDLLLPCITALGCLSRTFTASETRVIGPLVRLLDDREPPVTKEAIVALTKFACNENHLHVTHSKAIVDHGGARHLVQLVYLGDQLQVEALILLCYVALHVPESEELAQAGVLAVLLWASKQAQLVQDLRVDPLLSKAKGRLDLFQSRGSII